MDESYGKHTDVPGTAPSMSTRTHKGSQGSRNLLDKLKRWAGQLGTERSCELCFCLFFRFAVAGERF